MKLKRQYEVGLTSPRRGEVGFDAKRQIRVRGCAPIDTSYALTPSLSPWEREWVGIAETSETKQNPFAERLP
jgi:hypothetical protein